MSRKELRWELSRDLDAVYRGEAGEASDVFALVCWTRDDAHLSQLHVIGTRTDGEGMATTACGCLLRRDDGCETGAATFYTGVEALIAAMDAHAKVCAECLRPLSQSFAARYDTWKAIMDQEYAKATRAVKLDGKTQPGSIPRKDLRSYK